MTYEEFKQNFLPEFLNIKSFAGKIKYATERLQRIGSGSGRIVFDIDDQKVLKLAKNAKGVAQNEVEAGVGYYRDTQNIVTIVFDNADDDSWLISEKAKKVNEKRIKELTGIPSLNLLGYYLRDTVSVNNGRGRYFDHLITPEIREELDNNEFVIELVDFIMNYSQQPGDYNRPSTYGEVLRDGQPSIVLTDYGLNDEVYDTHYNRNRKQPYRMYELFDCADGNDDILSDIGNTGEIRHGMWALQPYGVSDGDGVINEDFQAFVSNRDYYPEKPLPSMPIMIERFHECIGNLRETLNQVSDKKKFYGNLLKLQEYLIRQGVYDRDRLELQEYEINENDSSPNVESGTLEDRNYATQLANAAAEKLGLTQPKLLGGGSNGLAFEINDNLVMKITADISEADAGMKILRGHPKRIAKVYNIYKLVDTEKDMAFYILLQENIKDKPVQQFWKYMKAIDSISPNGMDYVSILIAIKNANKFNYDAMIEVAKHILTDNPAANISEVDRQNTYKFLVDILDIRKELQTFDIKSWDYSNAENLGYKDGVLKFFDVGGYRAVEPEVGNNVIMLPEEANTLTEDYDRNTADAIANKVAEIKGYDIPRFIGSGLFGVAYDIANDKILKITKDNSEAVENLKLIGKPLKFIAKPYNIFSIKSNAKVPETYVIILEKLKTDPQKFKQIKERLDFVFGKILKLKYADVVDFYVRNDLYDNDVDVKKVEKYMQKNPQDAEFFNGIVNIGRECRQYGVESMDYLNYNNLGYKPDGSLGFFDVGFGDGFAQPQNAEKIEIGEDVSSKFSTYNEIGQDGFPVYNQNDTSPLTDNNVPPNNEDLEYRHVVGDATEDKFELDEERIKTFMPKSSSVEVKKKCRLGGLGNTSVACNQGDINNLELKSMNEEIDASEAYRDEDALQIVIDGKRGLSLITLGLRPHLYDDINDNGLKTIKIKQTNHPESLDMNIVYNPNSEKQAKRLYDIMMSHGGYVSDETPEEAREIGKLLSYSDESIDDYIKRKYRNLNENAEEIVCVPIKITPEIEEYVKKFDSDESLLRSGGLPTDLLDKAAFGFDDTLNKIAPKHLTVKWKDDMENVIHEIQRTGLSDYAWAKKIDLTEPIDVSFDGKKFYIEDGHHRYYAAKVLQKPLNINLEIKANPISKLGGNLDYDDFHRCIWKQVHNQTNTMNEAQLMSLQNLPFKQEVEQLGGKIHSVGGAVRDEFLGKESKDLDILITGIPMDKLEQLLSKYGRVDAVGKSFGILKFKPRGATEDIDIAIPRTEKPTGAGGHQSFDVTSDHALPIEKDLERRDFTINAIAKDINGNIIDPYGGQDDLKNKIIRAVNPQAFSDDPLRMLRAVQFASRFGFEIEPQTMRMIQNSAETIKSIPPERILTEFDKILKKGNKRTGAQLLKNTGLFQQIFGFDLKQSVIDKSPFEDVQTMGEFIYLLIRLLPNPAEYYKNNLKGDIDTYKLIRAIQMAFESGEATNLVEARSIAHNMYVISPQSLQSKILPDIIETAAQELLQGKYPKTIGELVINGNDLMSLGLKGKAVGDALKMMLLKIYSGKVANNKEELLSLINQDKNMLKEEKKPLEKIEYGALMLYLDIPVWDKITSVIKKEDIFDEPGFGIEHEPHLTLLYGFHKEVTAGDVFELYKKTTELKPIEIKIKGISIFENPDFDVVKFDVNSKILTEINDTMRQLPNTTKFPEYHAHITLAYVKKGEGEKYVRPFKNERIIIGNKLIFSTKTGDKETLNLNEKGLLKEGLEYSEVDNGQYRVNDEIVNIDFFIEKYDEWNNQGGEPGYKDPSEASVLEFFQNNYEDFSHNEKLKRNLLWALTDRDILNENS